MQLAAQRVVDILIIVMGSILVLFTLTLIILHIVTTASDRKQKWLKQKILSMLSVPMKIEYMRHQVHRLLEPDSDIHDIWQIRGIRSRRGLKVLELVSQELDDDKKDRLNAILSEEWYRQYMYKMLTGSREDTANVVTKLIAQLRMENFEGEIIRNLYLWNKNTDSQELGLMVLFTLGRLDLLIKLFSNPYFVLVLSYRTLQELIGSYPNDRRDLYRGLMKCSSDAYVIRACIRGIGMDGLTDMCGLILPQLDSENTNVQLDTIRSLGELKCAKAEEKIRRFTASPTWLLRSVSIEALAAIAPDNCFEEALRCLCDKEWWVRYHSAQILTDLPDQEKVAAAVKDTNDRYAADMYRFLSQRKVLLKGGATV